MCGHRQGHHPHACHCPNAKLERFIEPCMLLLLAERPSHGYELIERLGSSDLSVDAPDPGLAYRTLRRLEEQEMVTSTWETGGTGPARRLYQLTSEGLTYLAAWRQQIDHNVRRLQHFQQRHDVLISSEGGMKDERA